ncbi:MAG: substrate-binding domain-containing protein, partial [Planctomycetia bacterium]|nr:substrate-binding domain-containing protein [Planctomycetia bacterium]
TRLIATYGGGSRLLGQMVSVQEGDLFMPGAQLYVDKAVEKGLADAKSKRTVAYFVPVILVQKGNPKNIRSLRDMLRKGLRIGLGDERSCAIGKRTLEILARNNIEYSALAPNVVYKSATVNELGVAIQLRSVDAVIVWDANARHIARDGDIVPIPPAKNVLSEIPIVLLNSSLHPKEALEFITFVASDEGKKILGERGYTVTLPAEGQ